MTYTDFARRAEEAIAEYEVAAREYADATLRELTLEADRHPLKRQVVARLLTELNPETGKPHSATSAEKQVELDAEYAAHQVTVREVLGEKYEARTRMESARLRATLAIAALGALQGVAA